jgi:hypothetical protein
MRWMRISGRRIRMAKLRIVITATVEYEADPNMYFEGATPVQMLEIDLKNADDDTFMFLDNDDVNWDINGEVVDGASTHGN